MTNGKQQGRRTYTAGKTGSSKHEQKGSAAWVKPRLLLTLGLGLATISTLIVVLRGWSSDTESDAQPVAAIEETIRYEVMPVQDEADSLNVQTESNTPTQIASARADEPDEETELGFHDQFLLSLSPALRQIGIRPTLISRRAGSSTQPDRWNVTVPANFPLLRMNAEVSLLAAALGGRVHAAEQDSADLSCVDIQIGTDQVVTDIVRLDQEDDIRIRGTLAFVIDDCGNRPLSRTRGFLELQQQVTLSVFPNHRNSREIVEAARAASRDAMLHLPMQPISDDAPLESPTIMTLMSDEQIREITRNAIEALPGIVGINNHQGSAATQDRRVMNAVLSVVAEQNNDLFFVDSGTIPLDRSVVRAVAEEKRILTGRNRSFLDDDPDIDAIIARVRRAAELAEAGVNHSPAGLQNTVICIGHDRPTTLAALSRELPVLEAEGFRICSVRELLR